MRITLQWLCASFLVALSGPLAAQTYPSQPIKLISPFPPGGSVNSSGARGLNNIDGTGQKIGATCNTYTLTGSFTLADGHLLLKPELRMDAFNKLSGTGNENSQQFMDADGLYTKNGQTTLGMAAIYKF